MYDRQKAVHFAGNIEMYGAPKMTFSILFSRLLFCNYGLIIRKNECIIRISSALIAI